MITGFEEETGPLTDIELSMVPMFVASLRKKVGESNAVTSGVIIDKMGLVGHRLTGSRVRKIINYIRINRLVPNLVATSRGYYVETDPEKIRLYVESLKARAAAILAVADTFEPGVIQYPSGTNVWHKGKFWSKATPES